MLHWSEFKEGNHTWDKPSLNRKNRQKKKKPQWIGNIFTLDMEVSSIFVNPLTGKHFGFSYDISDYTEYHNYALPYIWQFSIDRTVYYGRYLTELYEFLMKLYKITEGYNVTIWVHNLAYEFQFLRNILSFEDVFARKERKPLYATTEHGFKFRCSYMLSGMSLNAIPKMYNLPVEKQKDFDYIKVRTPQSPLTDDELKYCEYDCLVLYEYIKYELQYVTDQEKIPNTKTAKVRNKFKAYIGSKAFRFWVKRNVTDHAPNMEDYLFISRAFSGGYTHANARHSNKLIKNVKSVDFASSYPYVMLVEDYPCSGVMIEEDDLSIESFEDDSVLSIATIRLTNVIAIHPFPIISISKLEDSEFITPDNGRVLEGDMVELTTSSIEWESIKRFYSYDTVEVISPIAYFFKRRLPKEMRLFIIELAKNKQDAKALWKKNPTPENELAMNLAKADINSMYGMTVTDNYKSVVTWSESQEWGSDNLLMTENHDMLKEKIDEANEKDKNAMLYQWGIFVTAYARRNLYNALLEFGDDAIYTDTDSVKYLAESHDVHKWYLEQYNYKCEERLNNELMDLKLDLVKYQFITQLGQFDVDGDYKEFKTLGAKKYCYETQDGKIGMTVSGVNKKTGVNALNGSVDTFAPKLKFDYYTSGKNSLTYNDNQQYGEFKYGIIIKPTTYLLDITDDYDRLISSYITHTESEDWI